MKRTSRALLLGGAGLCFLGALGLVSGYIVFLPNAAIGLLTLAIPVVSGGALLASGAMLGRAAKRREELLAATPPVERRDGSLPGEVP